jgi:hypothetical protein
VAGSLRDRLTTAAGQLKQAGLHDSAQAVESVLAPDGWQLLKQAGGTSPLSITIDAEVKAALLEAVEEFETTLRALAEEAYRRVLADKWLPPKTGQRYKSFTRSVLSVNIDAELRQQVRAKLPELSKREGRRISEAAIVVAWACEELGVDTGTGLTMNLGLSRPAKEHFIKAAEEAGVSMEAVVAERLRQLFDGSWSLPRPKRVPKGTRGDVEQTTMRVRVEDSLRSRLHEMAPQLSEAAGVRVFPGTVVRLILADRFGEPAE